MGGFKSKIWRNSPVQKASTVLSATDQKKILLIIGVQILMGILDLLGVIAIGALGALSVQGLESKPPGNRVSLVLRLLRISQLSLQSQVISLGLTAASILILKTILSMIFTRRTFFFLSRRGARVSADLISRLLAQDYLTVQSKSTQQTLYLVTEGVQNLMLGVLATSVQIVTDFSLLTIITIGLFIVDPVTAIAVISLFLIVGYMLHKLLRVRARELGRATFESTVESNEKILEVLNSYREIVVQNRRSYYSELIGNLRYKTSDVTAEFSFMPYISKYVIESATILGSLVLAGYEFSTNNAVHALSTMAIFLAASSRIAPSVLRIQQGILTVRNNLGSASQTIVMIDSFKDTVLESSSFSKIGFEYVGFKPILEVNNASFRYSKLSEFALDNVNLSIAPGSSAAIVGPSGAGKSTLVDLILGILRPDSGSIEISKVPSSRVSKIWPGAMAYVPQDVHLIRGSIRENVSLGYPLELASQQRVEKSLRVAQLLSTVEHLPNGFDTLIGEHGAELSGGQRQRLGIARALFTDPRFLVLDEATSALDGHTEAEFSEAIKELKGKVTVLIVAHRLSTIRNVDQVIYMQQGKVLATGSFEEVRSKVPDFDNQATGLGL